jgi:gamma-glutamyltranspeptidase/glutathione hydrolase
MRRVSIASGSQLSADAGAAIADAGGNAVDAAIAGVVVSMCTDPGVIAPSAGGFLTIWPGDGVPVVIDAYAEMPGRGIEPDDFGGGRRDVWMEYGGGMQTIVGPGSVAVPGALAGFGLACERYGSMPWRELLQPAIAAATDGFPVSGAAAQYLAYSHEAIFGWDPESRVLVHHDDGSPVGEGDVIRMPDLADTLRALADEGPDLLYRGELGRRIATAVGEGGGILTEADLAAYQPIVRDPVLVDLDAWKVATNPPPAVGGACLAAMLLLVEDHDFDAWSADEVQALVRVQRAVLGYRNRRLDPHGSDRAAEADALLRWAKMGDLGAIMSAPSTVHTSAVDSEGTACAITVSAGYGSGMIAPGTGFWLNNSLGEIELHPEGFHGVPTGTRLVSNMAPTVARGRNGSVMAIGSPGADRITTAISSVLLNFIHLGMSLSDAVHHPRVHAEVFEGVPTIAYEPGMPARPFDDFAVRRFPDLSMYFGGVQAALWDPAAGPFEGADPRRAGGTARGGTDHA